MTIFLVHFAEIDFFRRCNVTDKIMLSERPRKRALRLQFDIKIIDIHVICHATVKRQFKYYTE